MVTHILGKDEISGSSPDSGSMTKHELFLEVVQRELIIFTLADKINIGKRWKEIVKLHKKLYPRKVKNEVAHSGTHS